MFSDQIVPWKHFPSLLSFSTCFVAPVLPYPLPTFLCLLFPSLSLFWSYEPMVCSTPVPSVGACLCEFYCLFQAFGQLSSSVLTDRSPSEISISFPTSMILSTFWVFPEIFAPLRLLLPSPHCKAPRTFLWRLQKIHVMRCCKQSGSLHRDGSIPSYAPQNLGELGRLAVRLRKALSWWCNLCEYSLQG